MKKIIKIHKTKYAGVKEFVQATGEKPMVIARIAEEALFNLFTADIIKMKIKFTR